MDDLRVTTGDEGITIHCSYEVLELSPKVQGIEWRRNDKILERNNKTFDRERVKESSFTITSPSKKDTGKYSCIVSNAVGSVPKDVFIGNVLLIFFSYYIKYHHIQLNYYTKDMCFVSIFTMQ